jgi:hypothetical protein
MASGQSIAHARLMGAISRKRNRPSAYTDPPEPAAPEGFFLSEARLVRNIPAQAGTGDPDPGARAAEARAQKRGACRRERGASRIPMAERTLKGSLWRRVVQSVAMEFVFVIWFAASRGSANAGGEDFGYFAPGKERVRGPHAERRKQHRPFPANSVHDPW